MSLMISWQLLWASIHTPTPADTTTQPFGEFILFWNCKRYSRPTILRPLRNMLRWYSQVEEHHGNSNCCSNRLLCGRGRGGCYSRAGPGPVKANSHPALHKTPAVCFGLWTLLLVLEWAVIFKTCQLAYSGDQGKTTHTKNNGGDYLYLRLVCATPEPPQMH